MRRIDLSENSFLVCGTIPDHVLQEMGDFEKFWKQKPVIRSTFRIFGKTIETPRWTANYLLPYKFSNTVHDAQDLPAVFAPLFEWANRTLADAENRSHPAFHVLRDFRRKDRYSQALANFYENGKHYIGKHSDDERDLVPRSPIFSASFGQERVFRVRSKKDNKIVRDLIMPHGTYIVMCGNMQKEFTHEVPIVHGPKGEAMKRRINVTFRVMKSRDS